MSGWVCPRCQQIVDECDFSHFAMPMTKGYLYCCMTCYRELQKEVGKN